MSNFTQARSVVIPKSDKDILIKFDKSNLEFRTVMYLAGFDVTKIDSDAFTWMVGKAGGAFKEASVLANRDERFIAKTCTYSNLYGEGMLMLDKEDFAKPFTKKAIDLGALRVYDKWKYAGYTICFSGINMAERLFREASLENRAKANHIVEDIFMKEFPMIREWQQSVLKQAETGLIKSITGRFLKLYDRPKDNAKTSLAFLGQGLGADHVQTVILRFYQKYGREGVPLIMVHDELNFEKPRDWSTAQCIEFMSVSEEVDYRIPNFVCPVKMYRGENWAVMERIK